MQTIFYVGEALNFERVVEEFNAARQCHECYALGKHYHCDLCPPSVSFTVYSTTKCHVSQTHLDTKWVVTFSDFQIVSCKKAQTDKCFSNPHVYHHHCPKCGSIIQTRKYFENHLKTHDTEKKKVPNIDSISATGNPIGDTKPMAKECFHHSDKVPEESMKQEFVTIKVERGVQERVNCDICGINFHKKNLKRHMECKHGKVPGFSAICCDVRLSSGVLHMVVWGIRFTCRKLFTQLVKPKLNVKMNLVVNRCS